MKNLFLLLFCILNLHLFAQEKDSKKLEYVIIANNEIITKEKLKELGEQGMIKRVDKGVTKEKRDELAEIFGDKIGDREFIIEVGLLTKKEKLALENKPTPKTKDVPRAKNRKDDLKLNINDTATEFTVEMINGEKINLSDLKGKVVLLNYWATWCAPCLMEFTEFPEKIIERFKDDDFVLLAIAIGENKEKVVKKMDKMNKYGVDFNVGFDPKEEIWDQYASGIIPKSFIIDQHGIIKYISIGNSEGNVDKLAAEIQKLLQE